MTQALTLARPYARAAFAIAKEEGAFADWSNALAFASRVAADPRAASSLMHPQLRRRSNRGFDHALGFGDGAAAR